MNNLSTKSERGGVSDRNFPADFVMLSVMPARLSDMPLNPVKTLATTSETVGVSERARKPVKTLSRASDGVGISVSAMNPVKTLESASDGVGISVRSLMPLKNLVTTSEGAGFSVKLPETDIPERRAGHWCMSLYEALVG